MSEYYFITKQWLNVYVLLMRTSNLNDPYVLDMLGGSDPSIQGFSKFMEKIYSIMSPNAFSKVQKKMLDGVDPKLFSISDIVYRMKNPFLELKRIRLSNKYHSRLNATAPVHLGIDSMGQGFSPIEGWKSVEQLNTAGVFNMNNIVFRPSAKDRYAMKWFMEHSNRIMIDNGAFNASYNEQDFERIIKMYNAMQTFAKRTSYDTSGFQIQGQQDIFRSPIYSKITLVGPDKPQDAAVTVLLLKKFSDMLNDMLASTDMMFAVQTTDSIENMQNLISIVSDFGEKGIIGLPMTQQFQRKRNRHVIPWLISQINNKFHSFIGPEYYSRIMNRIMKHTETPILIDPNSIGAISSVVRFHFLGNSYGVAYRQALLNICLSNVLVKEMGLQCIQPNDFHMQLFSSLSYEHKILMIGKDFHPEVTRHIVSSDSSTWIGTVNASNKIIDAITGRQISTKQRTIFTESKNKSFKINLSLISTKIAESRYYNCLMESSSENQTWKDVSMDSKIRLEYEMGYLEANKNQQAIIRGKFAKQLKENGYWK